MNNELIVIEQANAVAVLSTDDGVKTLLENVRANIDSMDGGSMKNKTSRAKIRSNAFKAIKAYAKINGETIEPLIASLTAKIQPQLNVINAIKDNQSVLKSGLQQIRKDVNEEVDAFEAEIKRVEDEKLWLIMLEEAYKINDEHTQWRADQRLIQHMDAINDNHEFDKQKAEKAEADRIWAEKVENGRIAREKQIADDAAEAARLKAENEAAAENKRLEDEKQAAIKAQKDAELLAEQQKQAAIQAELDAEESEKQRVIAEENAKELAIKQEKQRVIDAEAAEIKRLADVKQAGINAANEIEADRVEEEKRTNDAAILRAKNQAHSTAVMTQTKESIIALGVPEEFAILVTKGLRIGAITNVGKIQF